MKDIEKTLELLHLSKNEIAIYLKLLELGSSKVGKIAKETNLDRSSTYNAITHLQNKGLVSYVIITKIKWYQAASPKKLLDIINEQKAELKNILPKLEDKYKQTKLKGQVTLYKGYKGVQTVFQDILQNADENLVFGSEGQLSNKMPHYYKHFINEQKEKNIKTKIIVRKQRQDEVRKNNYRFINQGIESPVVTNIYDNKIAIIIWTTEPEAIIIENKDAAQSYKSYFDFMWKNAK